VRPSDEVAAPPVEEPPESRSWAVLPNNFADFPARTSWLSLEPAAGGLAGRLAARVVVVILIGGLLGFGAFRWAATPGEVLAPLPVSVTVPAQDEAVATTPDAAAATTADDTGVPDLDLTGLTGNHAESQNWAGYAATEGGYTGVAATWTVPDRTPGSSAGVNAAWVGIGGVRSRDLIQAGTQHTVQNNGATQQEAWVELLPGASETVPLTIRPGDTVRVSIDQQARDTWLIAFNNLTSGRTYQVTRHYASSLSSAEWIEEAPSAGRRARPLPLDDFGTIRFTHASATRDTQVLTVAESGAHAITMTAPGGLALAEPSRLGADGDSFSVTRTSTPSPRRGR
jgi:hypothetical protein